MEKRVYLNTPERATPLARALALVFPRYRAHLAIARYPEALHGPLRNMILTTDRKCLFVRNLKCACTSVAQMMYFYGEGRFYPRSIHRAQKGILAARYHWHAVEPVWKAGTAFTFTFTRHPENRAYSAFTNFFVDKSNIATHNHWGPMQDHGYDEGRGVSYNFDVFLDYVAHTMEISPLRTDAHWRPQVLNIGYGRIDYDFIGKVENLNADIQTVFERGGAPGFPPREVLEARFNRSEAKKPPLTKAQRVRIRTLFAADFEAFAYSSS
jgi:hypothetical protein